MRLATRCPSCTTMFLVVEDQLRVSDGWVRCGRCGSVFNALEDLVDVDEGGPVHLDLSALQAGRRAVPKRLAPSAPRATRLAPEALDPPAPSGFPPRTAPHQPETRWVPGWRDEPVSPAAAHSPEPGPAPATAAAAPAGAAAPARAHAPAPAPAASAPDALPFEPAKPPAGSGLGEGPGRSPGWTTPLAPEPGGPGPDAGSQPWPAPVPPNDAPRPDLAGGASSTSWADPAGTPWSGPPGRPAPPSPGPDDRAYAATELLDPQRFVLDQDPDEPVPSAPLPAPASRRARLDLSDRAPGSPEPAPRGSGFGDLDDLPPNLLRAPSRIDGAQATPRGEGAGPAWPSSGSTAARPTAPVRPDLPTPSLPPSRDLPASADAADAADAATPSAAPAAIHATQAPPIDTEASSAAPARRTSGSTTVWGTTAWAAPGPGRDPMRDAGPAAARSAPGWVPAPSPALDRDWPRDTMAPSPPQPAFDALDDEDPFEPLAERPTEILDDRPSVWGETMRSPRAESPAQPETPEADDRHRQGPAEAGSAAPTLPPLQTPRPLHPPQASPPPERDEPGAPASRFGASGRRPFVDLADSRPTDHLDLVPPRTVDPAQPLAPWQLADPWRADLGTDDGTGASRALDQPASRDDAQPRPSTDSAQLSPFHADEDNLDRPAPDSFLPDGESLSAPADGSSTGLAPQELADRPVEPAASELPDDAPLSSRPPLDGADVAPLPTFVRQADRAARWRSPQMRLRLAAASLVLALLAAAQAALLWRHELAAHWPAAAAPLQTAAGWLGLTVQPLRRIQLLSVDSSALTRAPDGRAADPSAHLYLLSVRLRNRAETALMAPALELTLTDVRGEIVSRRVMQLADFGQPGSTLAAGQELQLRTGLDTGTQAVQGYTVELFYP